MGVDFGSTPSKKYKKMSNGINIGGIYDSKDKDSCVTQAKVIDVKDGMVKYEHVSRVRVSFVSTIDDFIREWKV